MMGRGPMMVYFGQELGESGMDAEGYSGTDGRTTIFDYWSVASVRRWLGKNSSTGAITAGQKKLREHYRRILNIANAEKAVSLGAFFDLMYVELRQRIRGSAPPLHIPADPPFKVFSGTKSRYMAEEICKDLGVFSGPDEHPALRRWRI